MGKEMSAGAGRGVCRGPTLVGGTPPGAKEGTSPPEIDGPARLRFSTHNFKFKEEETKTELYRLIRKLCSVLMFENGYSCLFQKQKPDKQSAVVEKVLSLLFY